jgi:hypothetical protein
MDRVITIVGEVSILKSATFYIEGKDEEEIRLAAIDKFYKEAHEDCEGVISIKEIRG